MFQYTQKKLFFRKASAKIADTLIKGLRKNPIELAVSSAEKIVGHPTSFLNVRELLSKEVGGTIAYQFSKLLKSNHPLVKTTRLVFNQINVTKK